MIQKKGRISGNILLKNPIPEFAKPKAKKKGGRGNSLAAEYRRLLHVIPSALTQQDSGTSAHFVGSILVGSSFLRISLIALLISNAFMPSIVRMFVMFLLFQGLKP